ncbi:macrocin-O-methyltransferase TylF [Natranaerovirga pectinivora]|uniref:Macrocin-O-methyltransferase TylF n=1 Tax=Natranaerovirga pectinivora TaxID=682400 RepID=A0A4R3MKN5_9FIRM|nr:TylF/MycF/NovP-related O-methyltransferase [Natranaerovirga pectinivora]TCT14025.1 macrocin-O-methyltransferase TylF [Natranaerovirga pectinivora]
MNNKEKIIIFGTGEGSKKVLEIIDLDKVEILAFVDNDINKQGNKYNEVEIVNPEAIHSLSYDYIIIASMFYEEILEQLLNMKIDKNKIVRLIKKKEKSAKQLIKEVYNKNAVYSLVVKDEYLSYYYKEYGICDMYLLNNDRNKQLYKYPDYLLNGIDYVRLSTVDLMAREIKEKEIAGAIAELGVYKGDFTRLINDYFPERKLYLFDTFEGFSKEDVNVEEENELSKAKVGHLGDTNVELVLRKLLHKDNVIIKKGYFPESVYDLEEKVYAFVSIDVDLFKPTYEGILYFYKKLAKGGYILVHDYNHPDYTGVKKAVKQACKELGINYIPLSDYFGSVVISK